MFTFQPCRSVNIGKQVNKHTPINLYLPPTKLRQGYVFRRVCLSFCHSVTFLQRPKNCDKSAHFVLPLSFCVVIFLFPVHKGFTETKECRISVRGETVSNYVISSHTHSVSVLYNFSSATLCGTYTYFH